MNVEAASELMDYNYINRVQHTDRLDRRWYISHIGLLILGLGFFIACAFHKNMWFDEAYTVAMIRHSFWRICEITARDVHPPLYYIILKLASLIGGQSIVVYRLASVIGMILFSLLGFTHIRKMFGNRIGFYYTFLAMFLPVMLEYSSEARMYSWALFFTTSAAIYAYLSYTQNKNKQWALFAAFSLLSAYTHYYALLGAFFINLTLLAAVVLHKKSLLKRCLLAIFAQVIFYLPWVFILINQIISVTQEYWIVINYPHLFRDFSVFYFAENLPEPVAKLLTFLLLTVCGLGLYQAAKFKNKHYEIPLVSLLIYAAVIVLALVLSLVKPIFITRYLMPNSGLLFIALAFGLAAFRRQAVPLVLCFAILIASLVNFHAHYNKIYDQANDSLSNAITYSLRADDIFLYTDIHPAGIYSVLFPNNKHYVYFQGGEEDSKPNPFQPELKIIYDLNALQEYNGRIWLIESSYSQILYGHLGQNEQLFTVIDFARTYDMPYLSHKGFVFVGSLMKKESGSVPALPNENE